MRITHVDPTIGLPISLIGITRRAMDQCVCTLVCIIRRDAI